MLGSFWWLPNHEPLADHSPLMTDSSIVPMSFQFMNCAHHIRLSHTRPANALCFRRGAIRWISCCNKRWLSWVSTSFIQVCQLGWSNQEGKRNAEFSASTIVSVVFFGGRTDVGSGYEVTLWFQEIIMSETWSVRPRSWRTINIKDWIPVKRATERCRYRVYPRWQ